jgi:hypothetical protein
MISASVSGYHDAHNHFPPAFVAGKDGRPMHSWRVLVLPYLGYKELYLRYRFDEPWDGPQNRLLAKEMPEVYRCPAAGRSDSYCTNYVAVVGPGTAWPASKFTSLKETHNARPGNNYGDTILIVEVADSDINWMEPRDMTLEQAMKGVNKDRVHGISSNHPGGAMCGLDVGRADFLPDDISPEKLKAMLTIK